MHYYKYIDPLSADDEKKDKERKEETKDPDAVNGASHSYDADHESTLEKLRARAEESDPAPSHSLSLRAILGGDILSAETVRRQIWMILLITLFLLIYVGFRYQCQRDMIAIERLETQLVDAKYRAMDSKSRLTERCRESRILDGLMANKDSTLHIAGQPPFIIIVPEE